MARERLRPTEARRILSGYASMRQRPWVKIDLDEQRRFRVAEAQALTDYVTGPLPGPYAQKRKEWTMPRRWTGGETYLRRRPQRRRCVKEAEPTDRGTGESSSSDPCDGHSEHHSSKSMHSTSNAAAARLGFRIPSGFQALFPDRQGVAKVLLAAIGD